MQLVSHRDLTASQARALTEQIRSKMGDLMTLITKAHMGRADLALGYESWEDYVAGEFKHAPLSVPREQRKPVHVLLRKQGMSPRAIAPLTGVSERTVHNDLTASKNCEPDLEYPPVTGLDGKTYRDYSVTDPKPEASTWEEELPAPPITVTCPTCGGTGKVTQQ